jgi:carbon storage regulator
MLVLTRKVGERIVINRETVVTVVEIRGDKCRLGFEAPKSVAIDREEVFVAKQNDTRNERTATSG